MKYISRLRIVPRRIMYWTTKKERNNRKGPPSRVWQWKPPNNQGQESISKDRNLPLVYSVVINCSWVMPHRIYDTCNPTKQKINLPIRDCKIVESVFQIELDALKYLLSSHRLLLLLLLSDCALESLGLLLESRGSASSKSWMSVLLGEVMVLKEMRFESWSFVLHKKKE